MTVTLMFRNFPSFSRSCVGETQSKIPGRCLGMKGTAHSSPAWTTSESDVFPLHHLRIHRPLITELSSSSRVFVARPPENLRKTRRAGSWMVGTH